MAKVIVYTKKYCPYCEGAKRLLETKGVSFEEIDVTGDEKKLQQLIKQTGHQTVPQVFINGQFVGGFDELEELDNLGELNKMLHIS